MLLYQWLFERKMQQKIFSEMLDISRNHLNGYIQKRCRISKKLAKQIETLTHGQVTVEELMRDNPERSYNSKKKR